MSQDQETLQIYSTKDAAEYLGVKLATIKYHLYQAKDLEADFRLGEGQLVFTKETLDHFNEHIRRPPGRPGSNEDVESVDMDHPDLPQRS